MPDMDQIDSDMVEAVEEVDPESDSEADVLRRLAIHSQRRLRQDFMEQDESEDGSDSSIVVEDVNVDQEENDDDDDDEFDFHDTHEDEDDDHDEEDDDDDDDEDEDDDDDDDDFDTSDPSELLRRLLYSRARSQRGSHSRVNGEHSDEDDETEQNDHSDDDEDASSQANDRRNGRDSRFDLLGAMSLGGGSDNARAQGFADVVLRLMGAVASSHERDREIDNLISNLENREDMYMILESLNDLSQRLLMMDGMTAERIIPDNRLAKALVLIMEDPTLTLELELQMVACRCLYNFLEVNQNFIHSALKNDAVRILCDKLYDVSYIDLTEQVLQTLEMISREDVSHSELLSHYGLLQCFQFLDFFTMHAQRKAFSIIANASKNIRPSHFDFVKGLLQPISQVVKTHFDAVVLENAWLTISRIIIGFRQRPDLLEELFDKDLLTEITKTIIRSFNQTRKDTTSSSTSSTPPLSFNSCMSLLRSLVIMSAVSVDISVILLEECDVGTMILTSLNNYSKSGSIDESEVLIDTIMVVPKDLVSEFLTLIGYLLPITYSRSPFLNDEIKSDEIKSTLDKKRVEIYSNEFQPTYWSFVNKIWSFLIHGFQSSMDFEIRKKILVSLDRIISFESDSLVQSLEGKNLSKLSNLLASAVNQGKSVVSKLSQEFHSLASSDGSTSLSQSKVNAGIIVLATLSLVRKLLQNDEGFFREFEKEGMFGDVGIVRDTLAEFKDTAEEEGPRPIHTFRLSSVNSYSNKYYDAELSKDDYFPGFKANDIFSIIFHSSAAIAQVYDLHLATDTTRSNSDSDSLQLLTMMLETLGDIRCYRSFIWDNWFELWQNLKSLILNEAVSNFELMSLGIVPQLASVLNNMDLDSDCYRSFAQTFFNDADCSNTAASTLVSKLQGALSRSELFDIVSSGTNPSTLHSGNSHPTAIMARQIKLQLTKKGDNEISSLDISNRNVFNMSSLMLSVHAIATFKTINGFLLLRMRFLSTFNHPGESTSSSLPQPMGEVGDERVDDQEDEILDDSSNASSKVEAKDEKNNNDDNMKEIGQPKSTAIEFYINDEVIPMGTTIYGAVYSSLQGHPDETIDPSRIWSVVHKVEYKEVEHVEQVDEIEEGDLKMVMYNRTSSESDLNDLTSYSILRLLKVLFEINEAVTSGHRPGAPILVDEFKGWKLTVKLNRQLEEPLVVASGILPGWCLFLTKNFPFVFPLTSRLFFLQSTSFGYSRLIHQWQMRVSGNTEPENQGALSRSIFGTQTRSINQLGRPTRHKVRISRKLLLPSAFKVLGVYGSTPRILEIEYFDEVGSGLGPTLEFYALVSKEFSKKRLRLWRGSSGDNLSSLNDADEDFVDAPSGLFPAPLTTAQLQSENGKKVLYIISSLGKFIARALLDSRIIDFNFNVVFLQLIRILSMNDLHPSEHTLRKIRNISSLRMVDRGLGDSLTFLSRYLEAYKDLDSLSQCEAVEVEGAKLSDLSLYFVLPGYPQFELIENGEDIPVTNKNLELYLDKVLDATLYGGVVAQVRAFMEGFSEVFPISTLVIFSPQELVGLFGNAEEDWSRETLSGAIHANHGYSKDSQLIEQLVNVLTEFNTDNKRKFLQFLTGSPKLPIGGFALLRPEFTVVRKKADDAELQDDDYLPSVMTCANYLKLPNYSSQEVMKTKLLQAINEGAGAFLLS